MCDTHFEYQVDHKDVFAKRGNAIVHSSVAQQIFRNSMTGTHPEMREFSWFIIYGWEILKCWLWCYAIQQQQQQQQPATDKSMFYVKWECNFLNWVLVWYKRDIFSIVHYKFIFHFPPIVNLNRIPYLPRCSPFLTRCIVFRTSLVRVVRKKKLLFT